MDDADHERLRKLLFPDSEEEWEQANAENEVAPTEPGTYKIKVERPPRRIEPYEIVCEYCGKVCRSGGGISFSDMKCPTHGDVADCMVVHIHWGENCPAWRHRWWRFSQKYGWGKAQNKWLSWKWRRHRKKERSDPNKWVEFWRKKGVK